VSVSYRIVTNAVRGNASNRSRLGRPHSTEHIKPLRRDRASLAAERATGSVGLPACRPAPPRARLGERRREGAGRLEGGGNSEGGTQRRSARGLAGPPSTRAPRGTCPTAHSHPQNRYHDPSPMPIKPISSPTPQTILQLLNQICTLSQKAVFPTQSALTERLR